AKQVLECVWAAPFLSSTRVVLVRDAEEFSAEDKEIILTYLKGRLNQHTCLILETVQSNLKQKFLLEVSKYARLVFCVPLKGKQLSDWLRERVKESGKKIVPEAEELLIEHLGADLQLLTSALNNLVLYTGNRELICREDVACLVGADFTANAFELFDAVSAGNAAGALGILDALLKDAVHPAQILGAFAHKIISERPKKNSFSFERRIRYLQLADRDIKLGRQNPRIALELLIARLLTDINRKIEA
ncbi:MAG: DNA polymerase III subunit delta, partial [Candidatus Omnitrophota bacterium]